jgi:hypothetical protein
MPARGRNLRAAPVVLLSLFLVGAALWAVLAPRETWPLTSGPMFAYYHAPESPLYEFDLIELGPKPVQLSATDFGTVEQSFMRWFFGSFYGSADPDNPNTARAAHDPVSFEMKMSDFCRRMLEIRRRRRGQAQPLSIELYEVNKSRRRRVAVVGHCQLDGRFVRPP